MENKMPLFGKINCRNLWKIVYHSHIGLSVYYYVLAQSEIGAARTSAYYAISPFIGVLLALLIFHELPGKLFWIALAIMAVGVYINVKDIQEVL